MKNTSRDFLLDMKSKFPEMSSIPHLDEIIARQLDDETMAKMDAEFMAELELSSTEEIDLTSDFVAATRPAGKATAPAPVASCSKKTRLISIRLSDALIAACQLQGLAKGTPYQSLIKRELALAAVRWKTCRPPV